MKEEKTFLPFRDIFTYSKLANLRKDSTLAVYVSILDPASNDARGLSVQTTLKFGKLCFSKSPTSRMYRNLPARSRTFAKKIDELPSELILGRKIS